MVPACSEKTVSPITDRRDLRDRVSIRRIRFIDAQIDSDLLTELMNKLDDARMVLDSALPRLPDNELALKESMETTIREIASSRMKVLMGLLYTAP
jgi:hypothetical protein